VVAGGRTLKADLDPAPAIRVHVTDPSFARLGDQIDVAGYYLKPGYAMADQVRITLASPLGDPLSEFAKARPGPKPVAKPAAKPANG